MTLADAEPPQQQWDGGLPFFLAGQECGPTKVRGDVGWSSARSQEIDKPGEGSQNLVSSVRGRAPNGLPEVAWAQTRWTGGRAIGEGPDSLADSRLGDSNRRGHQTRGQGWRGGLRVLSQHILENSGRGNGQTIRSQSLDGFTELAILNSQLRSSDVGGVLGGRQRTLGEGLCSSHSFGPESSQVSINPSLDACPH